MDKIPPALVKSLMDLGLLESEAKIYVALVMMNHSEVKELIDFLGISKPNTYESLRSLEEQGLIVAVSKRPIVYQAVAPEIGLEMLIDRHLKAKKCAGKLFSTLERDIQEHPPDEMWYIFTEKNVEYKIRDMLHNAKKSVYMAMSDRYVVFLESLTRKDIDIDLIVLTNKPATEKRLKKMPWPKGAKIQFIDQADMEKIFYVTKSGSKMKLTSTLTSLSLAPSIDRTFMLVVDDAETLYIPPIFGGMNAIHSHGLKMVQNLKSALQTMSTILRKNKI